MLTQAALYEVLCRARALLATPTQWTKKAMARNAKRDAVVPTHVTAIAYDISGALFRAGYDDGGMEATNELRDVLTRLSGVPESDRLWLIEWQDAPGRKHAEVLALFDAALEALAPEKTPELNDRALPDDDV